MFNVECLMIVMIVMLSVMCLMIVMLSVECLMLSVPHLTLNIQH